MAVLVIWLIAAVVTSLIAGAKSRRAGVWFVLGVLIPVLALLLVLLLPSRHAAREAEQAAKARRRAART